VVCDLSVFAPNSFSTGCGQAQISGVDLDDGALGDDVEAGLEFTLRILLDAQDVEAESGLQLWVCHVGFLHPEP